MAVAAARANERGRARSRACLHPLAKAALAGIAAMVVKRVMQGPGR